VITVQIADDQPLVRVGLRTIFDNEPDLAVVAEASDGVEACDLTRRHRPDVVLMDVRMPRIDGITATRNIVASGVDSRVLVLTTFDLDSYVYEALKAGASGFVLKDMPRDQLIHAVRVIADGETLLAPAITRRLIGRYLEHPGVGDRVVVDPKVKRLSDRETQVLSLVAQGMSNAEIADQLVVSQTTVKTHVASVLRKLEVRDRVQAVVLAFQSGLVTL
jgi:DNA-binding NarL/FixJ family response regulator